MILHVLNVLVTRNFPVRLRVVVYTCAIVVACNAVKAARKNFCVSNYFEIYLPLFDNSGGSSVNAAQAMGDDQDDVFRRYRKNGVVQVSDISKAVGERAVRCVGQYAKDVSEPSAASACLNVYAKLPTKDAYLRAKGDAFGDAQGANCL